MNRAELPNRRPHLVEEFEWNGRRWQLGLGFDDAGWSSRRPEPLDAAAARAQPY